MRATIELRNRRAADVEPPGAVVVQLQRQVRPPAGGDRGFQPSLERGVLRFGIRRLVPVAIEILAAQVESGSAPRHAILVRHGQHADAVDAQKPPGLVVVFQQPLDQALRDPVAP